MGLTFTKLFARLFSKREMRILMVSSSSSKSDEKRRRKENEKNDRWSKERGKKQPTARDASSLRPSASPSPSLLLAWCFQPGVSTREARRVPPTFVERSKSPEKVPKTEGILAPFECRRRRRRPLRRRRRRRASIGCPLLSFFFFSEEERRRALPLFSSLHSFLRRALVEHVLEASCSKGGGESGEQGSVAKWQKGALSFFCSSFFFFLLSSSVGVNGGKQRERLDPLFPSHSFLPLPNHHAFSPTTGRSGRRRKDDHPVQAQARVRELREKEEGR